jgi:hypothetical protein
VTRAECFQKADLCEYIAQVLSLDLTSYRNLMATATIWRRLGANFPPVKEGPAFPSSARSRHRAMGPSQATAAI